MPGRPVADQTLLLAVSRGVGPLDGGVPVSADIPEDHSVCFREGAPARGDGHLRGWRLRPVPYPLGVGDGLSLPQVFPPACPYCTSGWQHLEAPADPQGPCTGVSCRGTAIHGEQYGWQEAGTCCGSQSCGQLLPSGYLLLNLGADIGHVDFLEKVHGLAERPYVIAGLHFDQVSFPGSWWGVGVPWVPGVRLGYRQPVVGAKPWALN